MLVLRSSVPRLTKQESCNNKSGAIYIYIYIYTKLTYIVFVSEIRISLQRITSQAEKTSYKPSAPYRTINWGGLRCIQ